MHFAGKTISSTLVYLLPVYFLVFQNVSAKNVVDSLLQENENYQLEDSFKVDLQSQLGYHYWTLDPVASERYGGQALELATKLGYQKGKAFSNRVIGVSHWARGNYETALFYLFDGLEEYLMLRDSLGIGNCTMNIGLVYEDQLDYPLALDYYFDAIEYFKAIGRFDRIATTYNKIGMVYINLGRYGEALDFLTQALETHQYNEFTYGIAESYNRLGLLYSHEGDLEKGLYHLKLANQLSQKIEDYDGMARNLSAMGKIYLDQQRWDDAETALLQGLEAARQVKAKRWFRDLYLYLKDLNLHRQDLQKTIYYYDLYSATRDSLFNEELARRISAIELKNQRAEQQKELEIKSQAIQLLEAKNRSDQMIKLILAILVLLLGVIFYLIWKGQKLKIQRNQELFQKSREIYRTQHELSVTALENSRLKEMELHKELEFKNRELTAYTMNFIQKNDLLENLKRGLEDLKESNPSNLKRKLAQLQKQINQSSHLDRDWENFKIQFENVHQNFFSKLKQICPSITPAELKLCALTLMNLNLKETAAMLGISNESVKTARYRLRKKFDIPNGMNLFDFLIHLDRNQVEQISKATDLTT